MIVTGIYHKDVFMPKLNLSKVDMVMSYTYHAINAAKTDRYGEIELPEAINMADYEVVELEVVKNIPFKVTIRGHYDTRRDLVMVVLLRDNRVKTVWSNLKSDRHRTLKANNYLTKGDKR